MSSLTSLLARDEIVSVHAIEDALQRQVLEGGEIDTALLELGVVPENTLSAYLAATHGLQCAAREELAVADDTLKLMPVELARKHRMVPLQRAGGTLVVCTAKVPGPDVLHGLERAIGLAIMVKIAVHARVEAALATFYGVEISSRMRQLAAQLDAADPGPVPEVEPAEDAVLRIDSALLHAFDSQPPGPDADSETDEKQDQTPAPAPTPASAAYSFAPPVVKQDVSWSGAVPSAIPPEGKSTFAGPTRARFRVSMVPKGPLGPERARQLLDNAADRDSIVDVFFSFALQYFDCSALFAVRENQLLGLDAYGIMAVASIDSVCVPIAEGGVVQQVLTTMAPQVIEQDQSSEGSLLAHELGRADAQPSALIPVVVHQRVVSLFYGDCDGSAVRLSDLADLLASLPNVSLAFERIIRQRKKGAQRAQMPKPVQVLHQALGSLPPTRQERAQEQPPQPASPQAETPQAQPMQATPVVSVAPQVHVTEATEAPDEEAAADAQNSGTTVHASAASRARAMEALAALGMSRPAPLPPDLSGPLPQRPPTSRMRLPSKSPTKPPPGPGAYRSSGPTQVEHVGDVSFLTDNPVATPTPGQDEQQATAPPANAAKEDPKAAVEQTPHSVNATAKDTLPESPLALKRAADQNGTNERAGGEAEGANSQTSDQQAAQEDAVAKDRTRPVSDAPRDTTPELFAVVHALPDAKPRMPSIIVDMGEDIRRLVDELSRCGPGDEGPVLSALVKLGPAAVPILAEHFPGPLWFDRSTQPNRMAMGRDVSAVARAMLAFGAHAVPYVAELMTAPDADTRYYAALLAIERLEPLYLLSFGKAAFDADPQVKQLAREALPRYRALPEFASVLVELRTVAAQLQAPLQERLDAIEAITAVRDADALLVLIEALDQNNPQLAVPAHRALVLLTGQDFGTTAESWRAFARATSGQARVEWLIEALMQADEQHRALAGSELQKLTQVYFGYVASAPKRDRERVQRRYREWWDTQPRP